MNTCAISIPAFTRHVITENKQGALGLFWFGFDNAQAATDWGNPVVKIIKSNPKST